MTGFLSLMSRDGQRARVEHRRCGHDLQDVQSSAGLLDYYDTYASTARPPCRIRSTDERSHGKPEQFRRLLRRKRGTLEETPKCFFNQWLLQLARVLCNIFLASRSYINTYHDGKQDVSIDSRGAC